MPLEGKVKARFFAGLVVFSSILETCTTIDGSIASRLKWNFRFNSTLGTCYGVHLPVVAISASLKAQHIARPDNKPIEWIKLLFSVGIRWSLIIPN